MKTPSMPHASTRRTRPGRAFSAIALLAALGCAPWPVVVQAANANAGSAAPASSAAPFRLGPGDVLSVTVWRQPELSMQLPVAPDGSLRYPLAGHIDAQGRTLAEVEAELTQKLGEQIREAVVTVSLVQTHSYRVYVVGEVLRPGEFQLPGPVSVVQAIAMANSFTPFAKRDRLLVVRRKNGQETRQIFDFNAYVRDDAGQDLILEPGDTIIVQ
ncbi:polysaccharide biosynthesis/export family protein [Accumulibacter sp.]|uniref:polysaccharide biosynthesis/export family protein n=1 Tax=Accumulibacter sp. TaxID=2053492 RepID=UPI0025D478AF|nr:polysaccharide biosynthesis/export family protein [Accumulibacter sp.]MCP5229425.1 polysaccharide biosynthesis/export family protein [Accumulibacter sp.]